jgi:hypothetical protein
MFSAGCLNKFCLFHTLPFGVSDFQFYKAEDVELILDIFNITSYWSFISYPIGASDVIPLSIGASDVTAILIGAAGYVN